MLAAIGNLVILIALNLLNEVFKVWFLLKSEIELAYLRLYLHLQRFYKSSQVTVFIFKRLKKTKIVTLWVVLPYENL